VETTTLEQAAESLLAPGPETETEENNLSEAVEEITEPADDGQGEVVEAEAESVDDADTSSDDDFDDVEIDDLDQVEATGDTTLIPVKVDGKDEMKTLDQLKQSYSGQATINKRFQEIAQTRKENEQLREQLLQVLQSAQAGGMQPPISPSRDLFSSDPIGYMDAQLTYADSKAEYDQYQQNVEQLQQQQFQEQDQAHQSYLKEQLGQLQHHIPEFANPEQAAKLRDDIVQVGIDYGFSPEEMAAVSDSRYVRALNDARKYRQLVAKRAKAAQKGDKARPVVKAGARKAPETATATRNKMQQKLRKSGSIEDALSLMLKS
tara:strand:- start:229 stop:1188 length:960 start_codon:yes stop_codon:yes gene_type:complete